MLLPLRADMRGAVFVIVACGVAISCVGVAFCVCYGIGCVVFVVRGAVVGGGVYVMPCIIGVAAAVVFGVAVACCVRVWGMLIVVAVTCARCWRCGVVCAVGAVVVVVGGDIVGVVATSVVVVCCVCLHVWCCCGRVCACCCWW